MTALAFFDTISCIEIKEIQMKLFNRKPKDKIKVATAFTLKGLTKQVIQLEQKGFIKQGEIQSAMFDGTNIAYKQAMIKKASE
ncbi:hypothetical protein LP0004b_30 [Lactococcus phage LP0004b]|nr:hypothetical protein LP0004b_30 [Lactococcus phage LP0004b]ATE83839.1 hypothetical protein LP0109_29 [Lactococcus phage LP0109]